MTISGVYFIKNLTNGKMYVGSSIDIDRRWKRHKVDLLAGRHHSKPLQNAFNKYGLNCFGYFLAESATCTKKMAELEAKWIQMLDSVKNGYNINPFPYEIGLMPKSEEHRKKIGKAHVGRKLSEESKEKIRQKALGRKVGPMSEEQKKKLSEIKKGWKMPEEGKEKLRAFRLGRKTGPMPESQKKAISEAAIKWHAEKNCVS